MQHATAPGTKAHYTLLASSNMCYQPPRALTVCEYASKHTYWVGMYLG